MTNQFYESEQDKAQTADPTMRPDLDPITIEYLEKACDDFYFEMPDDDFGVYNSRGEQIGSTCSCEDYPCCGHGGE